MEYFLIRQILHMLHLSGRHELFYIVPMKALPPFPLHRRCRQPELMDQPGLDGRIHLRALRALERINRLSRTGAMYWPALCRLASESPNRPLKLLDIACGGGDVCRDLVRRANRKGMDLKIVGCDVSPTAIAFARQQAEAEGLSLEFLEFDALDGSLPDDCDALTCSLFLHHLDETDAVGLLRKMAQAARSLVLVNDLCRTQRGYVLAWLGSRLLTRSPIVHVDGPLSVQGAFTPEEALALAHQAGMQSARVSRHWPQRFLLSWSPAP